MHAQIDQRRPRAYETVTHARVHVSCRAAHTVEARASLVGAYEATDKKLTYTQRIKRAVKAAVASLGGRRITNHLRWGVTTLKRWRETGSHKNRPGQGRKPFWKEMTDEERTDLMDEVEHGVKLEDGVTREPINMDMTNSTLAKTVASRLHRTLRTVKDYMRTLLPHVKAFTQSSRPRHNKKNRPTRKTWSKRWLDMDKRNPKWRKQVVIIDQVKNYGGRLCRTKKRKLLSPLDPMFGSFREETASSSAGGKGAYEVQGMVCAGFAKQVPLVFGTGTTGQTPSSYKVRGMHAWHTCMRVWGLLT